MQRLILSDIHSNWQALQAVLADAEGKYQDIVCCGDLVGYNPAPAAVIEWTKANCAVVIRGNHDKVVAGIEDLKWFNETARVAALWTMRQLDSEQLEYLRGLPKGPLPQEQFEIFHGSPRDEDEYVTSTQEAVPCFSFLQSNLSFFGHTHLQGGFFAKAGRVGRIPAVAEDESEGSFELDPDLVYMVNPGSVGQPRDNDPRAAYALYDTEQKVVTLRRVLYPVENTARDIERAGLPNVLGLRLFRGM